MSSRGKKQQEDKPIEEKSQIHIKDAYDYQNRSFLHIPQDVGINLKGKHLFAAEKVVILVNN